MIKVKRYGVQSPCLDCSTRKIGCHGICEQYKQYKLKINEYNTKRDEDKFLRSDEYMKYSSGYYYKKRSPYQAQKHVRKGQLAIK